jgi:NTP pyrophosphatase (non-canonical NTP hydrolase)
MVELMSGDYISDDLYKKVRVIVGHIYKTNGGWTVTPGTVFEDTETGKVYVKQGERTEVEGSFVTPEFPVGSFQKMIDTQGKLFEMYSSRSEYKVPQEQHLLNTLFSLIEEAVEIKNTLGLKPWKNKKTVDKEKLLEEVADLTHFYLQLLYLLGIKFEDLYKEYMKKVMKNILRQIAVEEYSTDEVIEPAVNLLKEIVEDKEKPQKKEKIDDLSSFIIKLEKEIGMRISNTKIGNPEREALLGILDKLTELKGRYIIEKYGRSEP